MSQIYDLLILGGGPAGLAAAVYGGRAELKTAVLEAEFSGGQAARTHELVNYPGFGLGTSGIDIAIKFEQHAREFGAEIINDRAEQVDIKANPKVIIGISGTQYLAKAVIIAAGSRPRQLNIPGEEKFTGRGVSYCATCDGAFYKNKEVIVIGSGDSALIAAVFLTRFASKVKIVVSHAEGGLVANHRVIEQANANEKIVWLWQSVSKEIVGSDNVEGVVLENPATGEQHTESCDGVFCLIGSRPMTEMFGDAIELSESGHIITDEKMQTNIAGVYAAGDIREKYLRQVVTAAADGVIAATAAENYLAMQSTLAELQSRDKLLITFWLPRAEDAEEIVSALEEAAIAKYGEMAKERKSTSQQGELRAELGVDKNQPFAAVILQKGTLIDRIYP